MSFVRRLRRIDANLQRVLATEADAPPRQHLTAEEVEALRRPFAIADAPQWVDTLLALVRATPKAASRDNEVVTVVVPSAAPRLRQALRQHAPQVDLGKDWVAGYASARALCLVTRLAPRPDEGSEFLRSCRTRPGAPFVWIVSDDGAIDPLALGDHPHDESLVMIGAFTLVRP